MAKTLAPLFARFGFAPHDLTLYELAFTHSSVNGMLGTTHRDYERLEFLGDAVIEAVTSDYLFIEYPDRDEGFLTQLRSKIVTRPWRGMWRQKRQR